MPAFVPVLIEALQTAGVPRLFGVLGQGLEAGFREAALSRDLPFVSCHRESAACVMAAVTGELTGRPGVALSGSGAEAADSAARLGQARLDRAPMIFLSSGGGSHPHLASSVKASLATTPESAGRSVVRALGLAVTEPRGPVHLDVAAEHAPTRPSSLMPGERVPAPDSAALERAADLIRRARRPLSIAGLGCRPDDTRWLRAFAESIPTPVLVTAKAKGALPDPHPLAMGMVMPGGPEEPLMAAADLVIGFGLDPLEQARLGWACRSPILSLTRCPTSVLASGCESLSYAIASEVVGDIGVILEDLAPRLLGRAVADWDIAWLDRLRRQRLGVPDSSSSGLTSRRVVQIIREVLPDGAIATVDAGPHALSALASWQATDLGQLVIATGLETVGMALPAAIAARLCHADRPVVCFTDAAGLALTVMELETAARLDLSILVVVFGNGEPVSPAPGVQTFVADSERGLARVLPAALGGRGPAVIDARVDAASRI